MGALSVHLAIYKFALVARAIWPEHLTFPVRKTIAKRSSVNSVFGELHLALAIKSITKVSGQRNVAWQFQCAVPVALIVGKSAGELSSIRPSLGALSTHQIMLELAFVLSFVRPGKNPCSVHLVIQKLPFVSCT